MRSIIRQTMMPSNKKDTQSQQSEDIARAYFEARPGWSVTWKERLVVFHNQKLQHTQPLPRSVFDDHLSVQLP